MYAVNLATVESRRCLVALGAEYLHSSRTATVLLFRSLTSTKARLTRQTVADNFRDDHAWSPLFRKHAHHHHHHGKLKRGRKAKTISHMELDDDAGDVRTSDSATKPKHSRHGRPGGGADWKTIAKATKEPAYKGPWVSGTRQPDWIESLKGGSFVTPIESCGNSTGLSGHQTYRNGMYRCVLGCKCEAVRVRQLRLSPFSLGLVQLEPEKISPYDCKTVSKCFPAKTSQLKTREIEGAFLLLQ